MRKTKIICTMGPAVKSLDMVKALLKAGMNVARFNFSHGDYIYHKEMLDLVRKASQETKIPVALLMDTKGPEIRTGKVKDDQKIKLVQGKKITLTTDEVEGTEELLSISYKNLPHEICPGKHIMISDGLIDLEAVQVQENKIICNIRSGGEIGSRKNVNVKGIRTQLPAVTEKDVQDIMFAIENKFDYIAASFVRKPSDVMEIRGIVDISDEKIDIISKIEDEEGLENIDEIIRVSDAIMIARGDLGVQLAVEEVPLVQKRIIHKCNEKNKAVITATQMLDSMIKNPSPTRAEVTDVANAVLDGTDAIMLSGETASGKHPVKSVKMMEKIALQVENSEEFQSKHIVYHSGLKTSNIADIISQAASITACNIKANAILTPTLRGSTPKYISKYRPNQYIIAVTPHEEVVRKLMLYWGVYPIISEMTKDTDTMINNAIKIGKRARLIHSFDKLVLVAGMPVNSPIMLNTIRVHFVADIIGKGLRGYGTRITGRIVKANNLEEAIRKIKGDGMEILLTRYMDEYYKPLFKKLKGYILEEFSSISWEEIYQENHDLVALAGAAGSMEAIEDGQMVTLDGVEKLICDSSDLD